MDEWAEQMYARYFRDKPRGDLAPGPCSIERAREL